MARSRSNFKQRNLTRALRAMAAASVPVARVEIDTNGKISVITGDSKAAALTEEEMLDQELAELLSRNGAGQS
jgi:hypothetical protein